MNKISLEFTPQELDYIANVLAERPWKEANTLLSNIQNQVQAQQGVHHANGSNGVGQSAEH